MLPKCTTLEQPSAFAPVRSTQTFFKIRNYKFGSLGNPDPGVRQQAFATFSIASRSPNRLNIRDISLWFADGSNYPGTPNIRTRISWFEEGLSKIHAALKPGQRMLIEYKPFEPAFYHTDIADWGMALPPARNCRAASPSARGYGPSLPGAEHRADRGLAAGIKKCLAASISTTAAMRTTI